MHIKRLTKKLDRKLSLIFKPFCCLLGFWIILGSFPALAGEQLPPLLNNKLGMTLSLIPGGVYLMGSPPDEAGRYWHEGPQHKVKLSPFYIATKEITNTQYGKFLDATGHAPPLYWLDKTLNAPQQPVVGVTWEDAIAYANWVSQVTGEKYRLPTEAEWEAASRGGPVGQPFPWGSQPPDQGQHYLANYDPNPYDKDGFRYSAPVGSFPANGYGLYDMSGNVAEWCSDWYDAHYYSHSPYENPDGPESATYRVIRGGSWYNRARELRCAARQFFRPSGADGFIGFRLVRTALPQNR
jgi:formylglycine-generating enzyme required for sulfatase activity